MARRSPGITMGTAGLALLVAVAAAMPRASYAEVPERASGEAADAAAAEAVTERDVRAFFESYCFECHRGDDAESDLDLARFETAASLARDLKVWMKVAARLRNREMPPEDSTQPPEDARRRVAAWIDLTARTAGCAGGVDPGPAPLRRLNRSQYAATLRDLLGIAFDAGHALPEDGAGGEGFDNAAETLFLSPLHAEKYLEAAQEALVHAAQNSQTSSRRNVRPGSSRRRRRPPRVNILSVRPTDEIPPSEAARRILGEFLPRAFRRPVREGELERYLALFESAAARGEPFDDSILFALRAVLISPHFLFRLEEPNATAEPKLVGDFELATRLSYFLWNSMPDAELFQLASEGRLNDPETLAAQAVRMLKDTTKSREFAVSFVEQWLGTRELGRDIRPDRRLYRGYDEELEWAIKMEPVLFFQELLAENHSLLELLDSDFTFLDNKLGRLYGIRGKGQNLLRVDIPEGSHRGGVLTMAAVLAVSSYPHRTSPVLRGKWVLETILGTPPPPPPADVPELPEEAPGAPGATVRERLLVHRQNAVCASCHDRIDPIGFGLENYDVLGRWRTEEGARPIDAKGRLPDGTTFDGPEELKAILVARKDDVIRHLTAKMLGYALGRGLVAGDYCAVEQIVEKVKESDYRSQALILEVIQSVPFRYKAGARSQLRTRRF